MPKSEASAMMRPMTPARSRDSGRQSPAGYSGVNTDGIGIPLFVKPIRVIWMLQVPHGPPALDLRNRVEVVGWGQRRRRPLERPGVPRVVASGFAPSQRENHIDQEQENGRGLYG